MKDFEVNWPAMHRARFCFMREHDVTDWRDMTIRATKLYCKWMREHWGVDHTATSVDIVDEKKYSLFLLKFT